MTPLRAKYIRDLVIRGRSKHTQEAYTRYVRDFPLSTLPAPTLGTSLLRQPALSALPGRQKLAMARQADTESLTDQLLPLRLHSTGGTQFPDASQPAQTLPALVRLRRTESAGVRTQPTRGQSRNHRCLTYLGTEARLPSPSSLHCHRRSINLTSRIRGAVRFFYGVSR